MSDSTSCSGIMMIFDFFFFFLLTFLISLPAYICGSDFLETVIILQTTF